MRSNDIYAFIELCRINVYAMLNDIHTLIESKAILKQKETNALQVWKVINSVMII